MQAGWSYVDVRSVEEFVGAHPAGAWNVPLRLRDDAGELRENPDFLSALARAFPDRDAPLILGCQSGGRSAEAAARLRAAGYRRVATLPVGFDGVRGVFGELAQPGWRATGLPIATLPLPGRGYTPR